MLVEFSFRGYYAQHKADDLRSRPHAELMEEVGRIAAVIQCPMPSPEDVSWMQGNALAIKYRAKHGTASPSF